MRDDTREKGVSGEEVYGRASWRRISSYIEPVLKWDLYDETKDVSILTRIASFVRLVLSRTRLVSVTLRKSSSSN